MKQGRNLATLHHGPGLLDLWDIRYARCEGGDALMGAKPPAVWSGLFGASALTETAKFLFWKTTARHLNDLTKELG